MNITRVTTCAATRFHPPIDIPPQPTPRTSAPAWAPQPCGLTREELRAIVAEQLG